MNDKLNIDSIRASRVDSSHQETRDELFEQVTFLLSELDEQQSIVAAVKRLGVAQREYRAKDGSNEDKWKAINDERWAALEDLESLARKLTTEVKGG